MKFLGSGEPSNNTWKRIIRLAKRIAGPPPQHQDLELQPEDIQILVWCLSKPGRSTLVTIRPLNGGVLYIHSMAFNTQNMAADNQDSGTFRKLKVGREIYGEHFRGFCVHCESEGIVTCKCNTITCQKYHFRDPRYKSLGIDANCPNCGASFERLFSTSDLIVEDKEVRGGTELSPTTSRQLISRSE